MLGSSSTAQVEEIAVAAMVRETGRNGSGGVSAALGPGRIWPDRRMISQNVRPPARPISPRNPTPRAYSAQPSSVGTPLTTVALPPLHALYELPNKLSRPSTTGPTAPTMKPPSAHAIIPTLDLERRKRKSGRPRTTAWARATRKASLSNRKSCETTTMFHDSSISLAVRAVTESAATTAASSVADQRTIVRLCMPEN